MTSTKDTAAKTRRVIFYLLFDPRGDVDSYVPYKLERLRPFAEEIVVIANGALTPEGREALADVVDEVWERDNVGLDVGAYKWALERFGAERLAAFDELILMNYTWYGPVGSFEPLFNDMAHRDLDFWGITEHGETTPNPITLEGTMPRHIQSHWIAVRKQMFTSSAWRDYWAGMPVITSYSQSILNHESRFTSYFLEKGYTYSVAYPLENYPGTLHAAFERAQQLLEDGCPVLKRRPFFHDPLYLDREGVIGRRLIAIAESKGYSPTMILQNMAKNTQPKILNTNASLLEILPEQSINYDEERPLRLAATVHIFYEDMTDELLDNLSTLPGSYDLYVTTTDDVKAEFIRTRISERADASIGHSEVRVLPSNRGRDLSAFFIGCRDVATSDDYDLIVKVHSKKTVQQGAAVGTLFKHQQIDNLLGSPGYTSNIIGLFQKQPGLGVVFPPTVHIGFPTLGGAWFTNRGPTQELAKRLGIRVPIDDVSPLAPLGAMFIARPQALKLMFAEDIEYSDYAPETHHGDGSLAHVQERIVPLAAGELGYYCRTVANAEYAGISHTFLEYKLDRMSETVQGYAIDEIRELHDRNGLVQVLKDGRKVTFARYYLARFHPRLKQRLLLPYRALGRLKRMATTSVKAKSGES
ncbi:rhamnosyltransferase [Salinibacterium sp. CAN_S4]|uniref:rhamnan synthesis F family protein n=1 Tax=Salinibacterium sp. CAN_S4 TaxID=2787727 RepID=UPI0018EF7779